MSVSLRRLAGVPLLALLLALPATPEPPSASAEPAPVPVLGAAGGGDAYFPKDGNGGYDVEHYDLRVRYHPGRDRLRGRARLHAVATADLRGLHLDLALTPDAVRVPGHRVSFRKPDRHELRVVLEQGHLCGGGAVHRRGGLPRPTGPGPRRGTRARSSSAGVRRWPSASRRSVRGGSRATRPRTDKATYDISLRVPRGNQAVSNGELLGRTVTGRWVTVAVADGPTR